MTLNNAQQTEAKVIRTKRVPIQEFGTISKKLQTLYLCDSRNVLQMFLEINVGIFKQVLNYFMTNQYQSRTR